MIHNYWNSDKKCFVRIKTAKQVTVISHENRATSNVDYIHIIYVKKFFKCGYDNNVIIVTHVELVYQGTADECFINLASQKL